MDEKAKKCQEEMNILLKKYNFKMDFEINFPQYNPNMLPDTLKLALNIILKEKIVINPILVKEKNGN